MIGIRFFTTHCKYDLERKYPNKGIVGESSSGVLFNDIERCELIKNGLPIISNLEYNSVSENFIAYHAATLATDKLYFTYPETLP